MIAAYRSFWVNYFNFKGNCSRADFWQAMLIQIFVSKSLDQLDVMGGENYLLFDLIYLGFFFGCLMPILSLSMRRLNDLNKKWYHLLAGLIPIFGQIYLIVLFMKKGVSSPTVGDEWEMF